MDIWEFHSMDQNATLPSSDLKKLYTARPFDTLVTYDHEDNEVPCSLFGKFKSSPFRTFAITGLRCKAGLTFRDPLEIAYYFLEDFNPVIHSEKARLYDRLMAESYF